MHAADHDFTNDIKGVVLHPVRDIDPAAFLGKLMHLLNTDVIQLLDRILVRNHGRHGIKGRDLPPSILVSFIV